MDDPQKQKQVMASEDAVKGRYSNHTQVYHSKEEFVLDSFFLTPQGGALLHRTVMSPGHAKRTMMALQENIKKYEDQHGTIEAAEGQPNSTIGFQK